MTCDVGDHLAEIAVGVDGEHGAEDLVLFDLHPGLHSGEQGRRDLPSFGVRKTFACRDHLVLGGTE